MEPPERIARDLAKQLVVVGIPAHPDPAGSGAHWQVDVGPIGPLALVIHCFWYNRNMAGLMLGMNRANQRVGLDAPCEPPTQLYEGPEYFVIAREGNTGVDGRTRQVADAIAYARAWLAGADRARLVVEVPFLDECGRVTRALAARLDPRLLLRI